MVKILFFIAVVICSVYSKVIVTDKELSDEVNNLITKVETSVPEIHVELPVYGKEQSVHSINSHKHSDANNNKTLVQSSNSNNTSKINKEDVESNVLNRTICQGDSVLDNLVDSNVSSHDAVSCVVPNKVDNGTALILTPFIEKGQLEEARNACKVPPEAFLGLESYSGFLTVNKTFGSHIYFWYFPVEHKPVNEAPWIIWLQGGPGASSLTGLFDEIGPFKLIQNNKDFVLQRNQYTWLQNHSLLFIDNPVGTGYSFTEHQDGFVKDMATYSSHLHEVVQQFLQIFPELRTAPLFVAGESYAGKYVPALASEIHKHKDVTKSPINLKGLIVGNGYIDPSMISHVTLPFLYFGLLNKEQVDIVNPLLQSFQADISAKNSTAAKARWNNLIGILLSFSFQKQAYNFLKDDLPVGRYVSFLKRSDVKRALHVGDIKFSFVNVTVNSHMSSDFLSSSKHLFEELLEDYRVMVYCGHLDQMLPCVSAAEHYRTWKWSGVSEFLEAPRLPYIFNYRWAGYHKTGGNLTEVLIRGAGHMVPFDEPAPTQTLIARWTHNKPVSMHFGVFEGSYLQEWVKNNSMIYL